MSTPTLSHEELTDRILDMLIEIADDDEVREHLDDDLFEYGYLDSMGAVELLLAIEDELRVTIAPTEVPREEMNTANLIVSQVEKRLA